MVEYLPSKQAAAGSSPVFRSILKEFNKNNMAAWPSGKAGACKALIPQFESGCRLFVLSFYGRLY